MTRTLGITCWVVLLSCATAPTRRSAVLVLCGIGEPARDALRKALDDRDSFVRSRAEESLRKMDSHTRVRECLQSHPKLNQPNPLDTPASV